MERRKFGVEIEFVGLTQAQSEQAVRNCGVPFEGYMGYTHTTTPGWKLVWDGSVSGGYEVVSPILSGSEGMEQVKKVADALNAAGARITTKCGIHVHIDSRGMTVDEVKSIVRRYARFEGQIDSFMAPSRRNSVNILLKTITGRVASDIVNASASTLRNLASYMGSRYHKVNLQAILRHGTIEFRHHQGSVDSEKILNWIEFLQYFVAASRRIANGGGSVQRTIGGSPRPGSKRMRIAIWAREGITAREIGRRIDMNPALVVNHVYRLETDYGVSFRRTRIGRGADRDHSWVCERWFSESSTTTVHENGADAGLYDGIPETIARFYQARTEYFAGNRAA